MAIPNYITQNSSGNINIDCRGVPDKGFLDAVKTKDIIKFRIMSREDKAASQKYKPGGPDVIIKHITGETQVISRKELMRDYVFASGEKIKLSGLKSSQFYLAYNKCDENYKIMKLPDNCSATMPNGNEVKPGSYIIAKADDNGNIDKNTITSVQPQIFRKMFKVPMQEPIKTVMGRGSSKTSKLFTLFNKAKQRTGKMQRAPQMKPNFNSSEIGMNPANINIKSVNDAPEKKLWKPNINLDKRNTNQATAQATNNNTHYRFRVTAKLVDMNGKEVGFILQDLKSGNTRNVKTSELAQLCSKKLVENVMLVRNQRGTCFLQGNGCSLKNMNKVII